MGEDEVTADPKGNDAARRARAKAALEKLAATADPFERAFMNIEAAHARAGTPGFEDHHEFRIKDDVIRG